MTGELPTSNRSSLVLSEDDMKSVTSNGGVHDDIDHMIVEEKMLKGLFGN